MRKRFMHLLIMVLLFGLLPSGCAAPVNPSASPPTATASGDTGEWNTANPPPGSLPNARDVFSIAMPVHNKLINSQENKKVLAYQQGLFTEKGWAVSLKTIAADMDPTTRKLDIYNAIKLDLMANSKNDAYLVMYAANAKRLLEEGYTRPVDALIRETTPVLCDYLEEMNGQTDFYRDGIPAWIAGGVEYRTVLYLNQSVLNARGLFIASMTDVIDMLRANSDIHIGVDSGFDSVWDAWAAQSGYFPLRFYGMQGHFYARLDDDAHQPVPLEEIPGFQGFFYECMKLAVNGRILDISDSESIGSKKIAGYIGPLYDTMNRGYLISQNSKGKDYVVCPLRGCSLRESSAILPEASIKLCIPGNSANAEKVLRFAEWVLTNRENYELYQYGRNNVDYRLVGERIEYLFQGEALDDQSFGNLSQVYNLAKPPIFLNPTYRRVFSQAPVNYEEVVGSQETGTLPAWHRQEAQEAVKDINNAFSDVIAKRNDLLAGTVSAVAGTNPDYIDSDVSLAGLRAIEAKTHELAGQHAAMIAQWDKQRN